MSERFHSDTDLPGFETLQEALGEVQESFPFNNVRRLVKWEDSSVRLPGAFGGACVFQLKQLREKLKSLEGYEINYLQEFEGGHAAMVCKHIESGTLFMMDPFMLYVEPINLSRILENRRPEDHAAYPILRSSEQIRLEVRPMSPTVFQVTLYYNPWNQSEYVSYVYDASKLLPKHPPITEDRIKVEVPELVLRLFKRGEGTTTLAADVNTGSLVIRKKGVSARKIFQASDSFPKELEDISKRVHFEVSELLQVFAKAGRIYKGFRR